MSGRILTPNVSLSSATSQSQASIDVKDDLSGVAYGFVLVQPPGGYPQFTTQTVPFPMPSGTMVGYADIDQSQPTRSWTIAGYEVCDLALNCIYDNVPQNISNLFGITEFNFIR